MGKGVFYDAYKIGDCLINKQTKQVVRIATLTPYVLLSGAGFIYRLDNDIQVTTSELDKDYKRLDLSCPVAQVLYTSNSNKGGDK